jgi:asparagine synthetase B (glutamine-hydrolysing)
MNKTQRHRGPDDAGQHQDWVAGLALVTRYLANLDITGGLFDCIAAGHRLFLAMVCGKR